MIELISAEYFAFQGGRRENPYRYKEIQANALRYAAQVVYLNNLNFQCVDSAIQQLEKEAEKLCTEK